MSISDHCRKHPHETSAAACPECGFSYCADCIVYVKGPKKPPLCLQCALSLAGVRAGGAPKLSRRQRRRHGKLEKAAAAALAKSQQAVDPAPEAEAAPEPDRSDPNEWSSLKGDWKR